MAVSESVVDWVPRMGLVRRGRLRLPRDVRVEIECIAIVGSE